MTVHTQESSAALRAIRRRDVARRAAGEARSLRETGIHRAGLVARPFDPGCVVLVVAGELGSWAASQLDELAEHACAHADTELLIDLTELEHGNLDAELALARIYADALARGAHAEVYRPEGDPPSGLRRRTDARPSDHS